MDSATTGMMVGAGEKVQPPPIPIPIPAPTATNSNPNSSEPTTSSSPTIPGPSSPAGPPPRAIDPSPAKPPDPPKKLPFLLKYRSHKAFITGTVAIAIFTDIFLYGLIVPVFPFSLSDRTGVAEDDVQHWVAVLLAVYGAGLLGGSPVAGFFADRTETRRAPLLLGLLALIGSTLILCLGTSIAVLVVGRLLQGVAAAVVWTVGLALLVDTVGKEAIGKSMGIVSTAMGFGILSAPLLGGVVYDKGGYYSVFAMAFAIIALDIVLRVVLIEKRVAARYIVVPETPPDTPSGDLDVAGDLETRAGGTQSRPGSRPPPMEAKSEEEGQTGSGSEDYPARAVSEPTEPNEGEATVQSWKNKLPPFITLLGNPRLVMALVASMVQAILMTAFESTLPLHVKEIFDFGATGAGLIFLAIIIPTFIAPLVGAACDKYGPKWISAIGFIISCPFLILLRLPERRSTQQIVLMCAILALNGLSLTLSVTPMMAEITYSLADLEQRRPGRFGKNGAYAQAYGLFNVAYSAGTLIGPLWAGSLITKAGWGAVTLSLGLLSLVTAIPIIYYTGGPLRMSRLKRNQSRS